MARRAGGTPTPPQNRALVAQPRREGVLHPLDRPPRRGMGLGGQPAHAEGVALDGRRRQPLLRRDLGRRLAGLVGPAPWPCMRPRHHGLRPSLKATRDRHALVTFGIACSVMTGSSEAFRSCGTHSGGGSPRLGRGPKFAGGDQPLWRRAALSLGCAVQPEPPTRGQEGEGICPQRVAFGVHHPDPQGIVAARRLRRRPMRSRLVAR